MGDRSDGEMRAERDARLAERDAVHVLDQAEHERNEAEIERLEAQLAGAVEALREIAKVDPVDAALDPQRPVRIARAWLREHATAGGQ